MFSYIAIFLVFCDRKYCIIALNNYSCQVYILQQTDSNEVYILMCEVEYYTY